MHLKVRRDTLVRYALVYYLAGVVAEYDGTLGSHSTVPSTPLERTNRNSIKNLGTA